jgi:purine-binding chemotaxis protein CheW
MREEMDGRPQTDGRQHMEAVWRERSLRLAQRAVSAGGRRDAAPVIVVGIGNERYGIDLAEVAEVLPQVRATPVPGAAPVFAGVVDVHGEIRPVIDLRRFLGIETPAQGDSARTILLRRQGREMGLQVDRVEQIRWIEPEEFAGAGNTDAWNTDAWNTDAWNTELFRHIKGMTKDRLMLVGTEALFAALETGATV